MMINHNNLCLNQAWFVKNAIKMVVLSASIALVLFVLGSGRFWSDHPSVALLGQAQASEIEAAEHVHGPDDIHEDESHEVSDTSHDDHDHASDDDHEHDHEGFVVVSPEIRSALGLRSTQVRRGDLLKTLDLYGTVVARQQDTMEQRLPFAGIVSSVSVTLGQRVEAGAELLRVRSEQLLEWEQSLLLSAQEIQGLVRKQKILSKQIISELAELVGEIRIIQSDIKRLTDEVTMLERAGSGAVPQREINLRQGEQLTAQTRLDARLELARSYGLTDQQISGFPNWLSDQPEGVVPPAPPAVLHEIQQAETSIQVLQTRGAIARNQLELVGFPQDRLSRLEQGDTAALRGHLVLKAPQGGFVTELWTYPEATFAEHQPLLKLVDYEQVYVRAEVSEVDIEQVLKRSSDQIQLRVPALNNQSLTATVFFFDTAVAEDLRKAHLWCSVPNLAGQVLRDNMAVTVPVPLDAQAETVYIPRPALLTDGLEQVVFVDHGDEFERRVVSTGLKTFTRVEILSGLEPGESVVVSSARALLLAIRQPVAGDPHAGHAH